MEGNFSGRRGLEEIIDGYYWLEVGRVLLRLELDN